MIRALTCRLLLCSGAGTGPRARLLPAGSVPGEHLRRGWGRANPTAPTTRSQQRVAEVEPGGFGGPGGDESGIDGILCCAEMGKTPVPACATAPRCQAHPWRLHKEGDVALGLLLLEKPSVLPCAQRWAPSCLLLIKAAAAPDLPSAGWLQMGPAFGAAAPHSRLQLGAFSLGI